METTEPSKSNRDEQILNSSLLLLTFVTGLVDAASFLGLCHIFTANMTGNVVFMAFAAAGVAELSFVRSATALAAALLGSALAGHLDTRLFWRRRNEWLAFTFVLEAVLLTLSAASATSSVHAVVGADCATYMVIVLTAVTMGLRNGTIRRLGVPDLTTTVLTLTVAGLGFDSALAGGRSLRWKRRLGSLVSMFGGALTGVFLLRLSLCIVLIAAATITGICVVLQLTRDETSHEATLSTVPH